MKQLEGTRTHATLKDAYAHEAQANRRYLYFARQADLDGFPEIAGLFRDTAEGETSHAHGHMDFLKRVGDPVTGLPVGGTERDLESAIAGETEEAERGYPEMAKTAREEGFAEIAEWFETLARAERNHAERFNRGLASMR